MNMLYKLTNIKKEYSGKTVLDIKKLFIPENSIIGLSGPNGAGKSTLMRIMAFLEEPDHGSIIFRDSRIQKTGYNLRRSVTFLMQNAYLLKRTIYENLIFGLKLRNDHRDLKDRANKALNLVDLDPKKFLHRQWYELSGGEAQRVALASRFILKPDVLILDEPTASIDYDSSVSIRNALREYHRENRTTMIISSHDRLWLNAFTPFITQMLNGRIISEEEENILSGTWGPSPDGLCQMTAPDGTVITAPKAPFGETTGVLHPSDIILSVKRPLQSTMKNIIPGTVLALRSTGQEGILSVEIQTSLKSLHAMITLSSARELSIIPGTSVYLQFKATAIRWV